MTFIILVLSVTVGAIVTILAALLLPSGRKSWAWLIGAGGAMAVCVGVSWKYAFPSVPACAPEFAKLHLVRLEWRDMAPFHPSRQVYLAEYQFDGTEQDLLTIVSEALATRPQLGPQRIREDRSDPDGCRLRTVWASIPPLEKPVLPMGGELEITIYRCSAKAQWMVYVTVLRNRRM